MYTFMHGPLFQLMIWWRHTYSLFGWLVRIVAGSWRSTAGWFVWEKNIVSAGNLWSFTTNHSQMNRLWIMCHFFIGPCGIFLLVLVVVSYSTKRHGTVRPHFAFYSAMWLDDILPRVGFLIAHVSCSCYFTYHALVSPRVVFLFDHVVCSGSTAWSTINPS